MNNNIGYPGYPQYYVTTPPAQPTQPAYPAHAGRPLTAPSVMQGGYGGPSAGMAARAAQRAAANHPGLTSAYIRHEAGIEYNRRLDAALSGAPQTIQDAHRMHDDLLTAYRQGVITADEYGARANYLGQWVAAAERGRRDFFAPSTSTADIHRRNHEPDEDHRFAHMPG